MDINQLHVKNPYEGFDYLLYDLDLQGWGDITHVFNEILHRLNKTPDLIIEVGVWKGKSTEVLAKLTPKTTKIVSIDTWLGAAEFWKNKEDPERYKALNLVNGWPTVYYQFLANMLHLGLEKRVIPFPIVSLVASEWLYDNKITAPVIFIDASHKYEHVLYDMMAFWGVLEDGGYMFGDDYNTWPGINQALETFGKPYEIIDGRYWLIKKG